MLTQKEDATVEHESTSNAVDNTANRSTNSRTQDSKLVTIWHLTVFPRLLILSLYQFTVYLNKLYQDCNAVAMYYEQQQTYFCIVSVASLVLPVFMFAIFQIATYLAKRELTEPEELGTKTVNGLLLIPWQIKRHLDKLYFVSQRVCFCRNLSEDEDEEILLLERQAMVLEFFEDFFAGLLQILLQTYIFITSVQYNLKIEPFLGVLIGSGLSILQLLMSVRRRDDGILTGILSFFGWICLAVSRAIALSLVASIIHFWVILLVLGHAFIVSVWVTSIAVRSYNQMSTQTTSPITKRKGISMFLLVFVLFGLPSLTYWPIMFQLKERRRPYIFLLLTLVENVVLFCFWFFFKGEHVWSSTNTLLTSLMFGSCILGILFLSFYTCIKPKLTDVIVLYNMKKMNENSYGIYYDFFEVVFQLPCTDNIGNELEEAKNMLR